MIVSTVFFKECTLQLTMSLFVNYEDFEDGIKEKINFLKNEKVTFFSGYDCDSLAFEKISGFVSYFLPFLKNFLMWKLS